MASKDKTPALSEIKATQAEHQQMASTLRSHVQRIYTRPHLLESLGASLGGLCRVLPKGEQLVLQGCHGGRQATHRGVAVGQICVGGPQALLYQLHLLPQRNVQPSTTAVQEYSKDRSPGFACMTNALITRLRFPQHTIVPVESRTAKRRAKRTCLAAASEPFAVFSCFSKATLDADAASSSSVWDDTCEAQG
jgi:hypothetical protein